MPNIFARSPYIIEINETGQTSSKVELFIWNGTGSAPSTPTYTLSKNVPSTTNLKTSYDISPFIREYINFDEPQVYTNSVTLTDTNQWCNVRVKRYKNTGTLLNTIDYIAYDGYGYFEQGYNPDNGDTSLPESTYYYYSSGDVTTSLDIIRMHLTAGTELNYYTPSSGLTGITIPTTGIYNIPSILEWNPNETWDLNIVQSTPAKTWNYKFIPIEECKYDVVPIEFVNKCGAWQKIWFFKASSNSIETSGAEYNLLSANVNYDVNVGSKKVFNVNGTQSIKVNSGWVNDDYAETIQQLLLSERILVDGKPAKMKTKGIEKQKQINTKMINYQLEFDYAYDIINNMK
jgi:hypothetical protein